MIIYKKNNEIIRKVQQEDINKILEIYNCNDFDYKDIQIVPKPSINEMKRLIYNIISEQILTVQIIVLEQEKNIIGYALIEKNFPNVYYINQFVIISEERNKGYGKKLLNIIKKIASSDKSNIELDTLPKTGEFFEKAGFKRNNNNYKYDYKNTNASYDKSIFYSKEEVKEKNKQEVEKQIEKSKVFLKKIKNNQYI